MFTEFVGITQEVSNLIELHRKNSTETKCDILQRVLQKPAEKRPAAKERVLDIGQGATLKVGEEIYLFLSDESKKLFKAGRKKCDGVATVGVDGIYVNNEKIPPSRGSSLQPAMRLFQEKLGHRNSNGEVIALSAWRQWHVLRDGQLIPIVDLKDPAKARKRGRSVFGQMLKQLGPIDGR